MLALSPVRAGAALLPWVAMLILVAPMSGKLAERVPMARLISTGLLVMGAGLLLLSRAHETSGYAALVPGLVVGGLGAALTIPLSGVAVGAVPVAKAGVASGVFNTARETGGSLGIAVTGAVLAFGQGRATAGGGSPLHSFAVGYSDGLTLAAVLVFAVAPLAAVGLRTRAARAVSATAPGGEGAAPVTEDALALS